MLESAIRSMNDLYRRIDERYFQNFAFVHINRTGGTSIEKALGVRHTHRTAREIRAELGARYWEAKFTFSVIRNPWDKIVSQYHNLLTTDTGWVEPPTFNDWVEACLVHNDPLYHRPRMSIPQVDWLSDSEGRMLVRFVARFETLEEDFRFICRQIGKSTRLPHHNASDHEDYRGYYDAVSYEVVEEWAKEDIRRFGYRFG